MTLPSTTCVTIWLFDHVTIFNLACRCRTWGRTGLSQGDQLSWTSCQWNPTNKSRSRTWQFHNHVPIVLQFFNLPRLILGSLLHGRALHGGYKTLFGDDVILKLDVVLSSVLGVHHEEGKVEWLFGSPLNTIHPVAWITWNTRRHCLIHAC